MREVKDFAGYFVKEDGTIVGKRRSALKGKITWDGYSEVILSEDKRRRCVRVHILVAETYLGERTEGIQVNHKDGNKLNNAVDNLEYVTNGENVRHAFVNNLFTSKDFKGKRVPSSLTKEEILDMKMMRESGELYKTISKKYNLSTRDDYIGEILSGRKLSEISGIVYNK